VGLFGTSSFFLGEVLLLVERVAALLERISQVAFCLLLLVLLQGISSAEESLTIRGLFAEETMVPLVMIRELPQVTEQVIPLTSAGPAEPYSATGALLSDLLAEYGKGQDGLLGIRLLASDGYSVDVPREILLQRQIMLVHTVDAKPLADQGEALRVVIPGERAMYWVRNLTEIEIMGHVQFAETKTVYFLESLAARVPLIDYAYNGEVDQALRIGDTLEKLGLTGQPTRILFTAADGFEKSETPGTFSSSYIKMTGEHAPLFLSPELPEGMQIRDIVCIIYADHAFVSLRQAFEYYQSVNVDNVKALPLAELLADLGMVQGERFRLTALDGSQTELEAEELMGGFLFFAESQIVSSFPDLGPNGAVQGLYMIEMQP